MENVTISHNRKTDLINDFDSTIDRANGSFQIYNSIIYQNTNPPNNGQIRSGNTVSNCIVENGYSTGTNILNVNPLFVNPNNLVSAPFDCTNYDYKLQNNSQSINYGNNSFVTTSQDLENNARIQQTNVDLGAYENTGNLSIEETTQIKNNLHDLWECHI